MLTYCVYLCKYWMCLRKEHRINNLGVGFYLSAILKLISYVDLTEFIMLEHVGDFINF